MPPIPQGRNLEKRQGAFAPLNLWEKVKNCTMTQTRRRCQNVNIQEVIVFIFVLLGKSIGRQTVTRIHEQEA